MTSSTKKFDIFSSDDFGDFWKSLNAYGVYLFFVLFISLVLWFIIIFYVALARGALLIEIESNTLIELYWFTLLNKLRRIQKVTLNNVKKISCNCTNEYYEIYTFEYEDGTEETLKIVNYNSKTVKSTLYSIIKKPIEVIDTIGIIQYPRDYQ